MRLLRVGLKTGNLVGLDHKSITLISKTGFAIRDIEAAPVAVGLGAAGASVEVFGQPGTTALVLATAGRQSIMGKQIRLASLHNSTFSMKSESEAGLPEKPEQTYLGELELTAHAGAVRVVLTCDLETYVRGVLQSEVPSYFKLEAMKAQAVAARTYGLRPRLSHTEDGFNVCDSYLHCQAFYGVRPLSASQKTAIMDTNNEILIYHGEPALALFSACAGGHTEDYQNAFSQPLTDLFPPPPIPYLKGVAEGTLPVGYPLEPALRTLWSMPAPHTVDAWSQGHFRWKQEVSANALESHMHHYADKLATDSEFESFVHPPLDGRFGHIKKFVVNRRGVAGTVMTLAVETSEGKWLFDKELTIRCLFENPEIGLKRLKSARIFFDHSYNRLGLLKSIIIYGFGSGHGVGMQQVGAQGLATQNKTYKQIIHHYYRGTQIGSA